ncbi:hypothetical protein BCV70DRAFT_107743 [Testicularia cyperi]|uniref:Uncharacterized protein n=1 Tax=Testicularia cyperi TaxID=1882483 RepID=A0A317XPJ2_9BASI|nr:hypothetical protein BCV70DRAFT_107743 [Testicularia cyperi]
MTFVDPAGLLGAARSGSTIMLFNLRPALIALPWLAGRCGVVIVRVLLRPAPAFRILYYQPEPGINIGMLVSLLWTVTDERPLWNRVVAAPGARSQ